MPAETFPVAEFIKEEMKARGWNETDLAIHGELTVSLVVDLLFGSVRVTPTIARGLAKAFGTGPELWLNLEESHQKVPTP
jgi:plasmid maintenance system antidote protein VapI